MIAIYVCNVSDVNGIGRARPRCSALWWCLPFSPADALVFLVPMLLLAFDATVGSVPAAVVHCLLFTVEALKREMRKRTSQM